MHIEKETRYIIIFETHSPRLRGNIFLPNLYFGRSLIYECRATDTRITRMCQFTCSFVAFYEEANSKALVFRK